VRYELDFYISENGIHHSHCPESQKFNIPFILRQNNWIMLYPLHYQNKWICGLCSFSGIINVRKQRFGNWDCFHLRARVGGHLLCWVSYKELIPITALSLFLPQRENKKKSMQYGISVSSRMFVTALTTKDIVFWDMKPCGSGKKNRRCGGTYCLNLQGDNNLRARNNVSTN
jgi:hypothetical protein